MSEFFAMDQSVAIRPSMAELVVLSDCLARLSRQESLHSLVDNAEQIALWSLDSELERGNPVILSPGYAKFLQQAKSYLTRGTDQ